MSDPADHEAVLDAELRDRLARRYAHPPRHYHSFTHAATVAERAAALGGGRAVLLAAWFHDVVYDPTRQDNEERSATLAEAWLAGDPDAADVARLVRVTASHEPPEADGEAALLCDADLAVLGGSASEYAAYRQAVRAEYAHVDEASWREGRAAVLEGFLARAHIYHTPVGRARWEAPARRNLSAELAALRS